MKVFCSPLGWFPLASPIIDSVDKMLHDQLTYIICLEYYSRFKFGMVK